MTQGPDLATVRKQKRPVQKHFGFEQFGNLETNGSTVGANKDFARLIKRH